MKNWLGYRDTISFEDAAENSVENRPTQTAQQIAARYAHVLDEPEMERPEL